VPSSESPVAADESLLDADGSGRLLGSSVVADVALGAVVARPTTAGAGGRRNRYEKPYAPPPIARTATTARPIRSQHRPGREFE